MKVNLASGIYPTMITPFDKYNHVNFDAIEEMTHWYIEKGCQGVFAVCQSSEIFYLDLDEKIEIVRRVSEISKNHLLADGQKMTVVASGHTSFTPESQAKELQEIYAAGADAVVLITNRMDYGRSSDAKWIEDTQHLLSMLSESIPLGLYECPWPYKRLLSSQMLKWCIQSGRFQFIKDTCCNEQVLSERLSMLKNTGIKLFNANAQTLLPSLKEGAAGYCGVMANFHPHIYVWLYENYQKNPQLAEKIAAILSLAAFTETASYPITAKYHLSELEGIRMEYHTRCKPSSILTEYDKLIIRQMKLIFDECEKVLT